MNQLTKVRRSEVITAYLSDTLQHQDTLCQFCYFYSASVYNLSYASAAIVGMSCLSVRLSNAGVVKQRS